MNMSVFRRSHIVVESQCDIGLTAIAFNRLDQLYASSTGKRAYVTQNSPFSFLAVFVEWRDWNYRETAWIVH